MRKTTQSPWLWLLRFIGLIVPRRLRADWRQEWEAELQWREMQLAEWDHLDIVHHGSPETGMAEPIGSTPSSPPPLTVSGFPWSWNGNVGRLMARCANAACSDGEA